MTPTPTVTITPTISVTPTISSPAPSPPALPPFGASATSGGLAATCGVYYPQTNLVIGSGSLVYNSITNVLTGRGSGAIAGGITCPTTSTYTGSTILTATGGTYGPGGIGPFYSWTLAGTASGSATIQVNKLVYGVNNNKCSISVSSSGPDGSFGSWQGTLTLEARSVLHQPPTHTLVIDVDIVINHTGAQQLIVSPSITGTSSSCGPVGMGWRHSFGGNLGGTITGGIYRTIISQSLTVTPGYTINPGWEGQINPNSTMIVSSGFTGYGPTNNTGVCGDTGNITIYVTYTVTAADGLGNQVTNSRQVPIVLSNSP